MSESLQARFALSLFLVIMALNWMGCSGSKYPYYHLEDFPADQQISNTSNPSVEDVESTFNKIRPNKRLLSVQVGPQIPRGRYTLDPPSKPGKQIDHHFQGIQKLLKGNSIYMVISGSDPHEPMSHLFVAKMKSHLAQGLSTSNPGGDAPSPDGEIVTTIGVDKKWHAGGISVLGDILAVPIYNTRPKFWFLRKWIIGGLWEWGSVKVKSRIRFFHLKNPEKPSQFVHQVSIQAANAKFYAVALTKLPSNDHFILAVLKDDGKKGRRLDFYLSAGKDFAAGFAKNPQKAEWKKPRDFEAIHLINQNDGRLYLVGLYNKADVAPVEGGQNSVYLYEVELPESMKKPGPELGTIAIKDGRETLRWNSELDLASVGDKPNLDAGGGIHIDESGQLSIYATSHLVKDKCLNLCDTSSRSKGY